MSLKMSLELISLSSFFCFSSSKTSVAFFSLLRSLVALAASMKVELIISLFLLPTSVVSSISF